MDTKQLETLEVQDGKEQFDMLIFLKLCKMNIRFLFSVVTVILLVTTVWMFLQKREYTAVVDILPNITGNEGKYSSLIGIASSFGLGGGAKEIQFSDLYEDILTSRSFAARFLSKEFTNPWNGKQETLLKINKAQNTNNQLNTIHSIIASNTEVFKNQVSGIIQVRYVSYDPNLSQEILKQIIQELDAYESEEYRNKARDTRLFVKKNLEDLKKKLREQEDGLITFLNANKNLSSPNIRIQYERKVREVEVYGEMLKLVSRQYETAKLEEQQNQSIIQVLDEPYASTTPSFPKKKMILIGMFLFSVVLSFVLLYVIYSLRDIFPKLSRIISAER
jgi:uncharacterized protein involved in exopolysaccharide biosynthesis